MVNRMKNKQRPRVQLPFIGNAALARALVILLCAMPTSAMTSEAAAPVLLTFDVELPDDFPALKAMALDEPVTHFVTGEMAEKFPNEVRALLPGNTIGSHGYAHDDLTTLSPSLMRIDLESAAQALASVTGQKPLWFRAPYTNANEAIYNALADIGFKYDSSETESLWQNPARLLEMPISETPDHLVGSDFELIQRQKLSGDKLARWMIELYDGHASSGRATVLLLHPRLIAPEAAALHTFIDHVRATGGHFVNAQNYVDTLLASHNPAPAIWLNPADQNPQELADAAASEGVSDAFIKVHNSNGDPLHSKCGGGAASDPFGKMVNALHRKGIRVHAWLSVTDNPALATSQPALAMVDAHGVKSTSYVEPGNPEVAANLHKTASCLIGSYAIDGIHLDHLAYPDLSHNLADSVTAAFASEANLGEITIGELFERHYSAWINWRASRLTRLALDLKSNLAQLDNTVSLSATVTETSLLTHAGYETSGQNFSELARHLDLIVPVASSSMQVERLRFAALQRSAGTAVQIRVDAPSNSWTHTAALNTGNTDGHLSWLPGMRTLTDSSLMIPLTGMSASIALLIVMRLPSSKRNRKSQSEGPMRTLDIDPNVSWSVINSCIDEGTIPGNVARIVAEKLNRFNPKRIEQYRMAYLLETALQPSVPSHLSKDQENFTGWRRIMRTYQHKALDAGFVMQDSTGATRRLTSAGKAFLSSAKDDGYRRSDWEHVEIRLHESLHANCPDCATRNHVFWFWPDFDCIGCGRSINLTECNDITIEPARFSSSSESATDSNFQPRDDSYILHEPRTTRPYALGKSHELQQLREKLQSERL